MVTLLPVRRCYNVSYAVNNTRALLYCSAQDEGDIAEWRCPVW